VRHIGERPASSLKRPLPAAVLAFDAAVPPAAARSTGFGCGEAGRGALADVSHPERRLEAGGMPDGEPAGDDARGASATAFPLAALLL